MCEKWEEGQSEARGGRTWKGPCEPLSHHATPGRDLIEGFDSSLKFVCILLGVFPQKKKEERTEEEKCSSKNRF